MQSVQQSIGASSQHSLGDEPFSNSGRNTSLQNINVPKIKGGIYKNAGLSGHKTQQNANGLLVSNQSGVQKKTFEYLTSNMGNESAAHAHTLDDKVRMEDKGL